jgi:hypothetical protein
MSRNTHIIAAWLGLLLAGTAAWAQNAPITFENGGPGSGWTWSVFENSTNPAVEMVANPAPSTLNPSSQAMRFTALQAGQPWAGCESQHGADLGTFTLSEANCTVSLLVYKSVISNVGVKFARADGMADVEVLVPNTLVNQWEELVFDFSGRIGNAASTNIDQIIFFPDFNMAGRTGDNMVYIDNVTFGPRVMPNGPTVAAPLPAHDSAHVISLFSDSYSAVPVDSWSAVWDQAEVSSYQIGGNNMKYYSNMVFAGVEFTSQTINATAMSHFHMDIWTPNPTSMPTAFRIKLVDFGANGVWNGGGDDVEHELSFDATSNPPLVTGNWISFDLPLSAFTGLVTRGHLAQLVLSGGLSTVFVDNVYFHDGTVGVEERAPRARSAKLGPNHPNPFNPSTQLGYELATPGHVRLAIYNLQGSLVKVLVDAPLSAGGHHATWDGMDEAGKPQASGLYLSRLELDGRVAGTRRMSLIR